MINCINENTRCPECPIHEIKHDGLRYSTTALMSLVGKWHNLELVTKPSYEEITSMLRDEASVNTIHSLFGTNILKIAARAFSQGLSEACSSDSHVTPEVVKV